MTWIIALVLVAIGVVALFVLAWWGLPILAVLAILGAVYLMRARSEDPSAGTIERGRRMEPTGVPRKATADAETANERAGQA